MKYIIEIRRFYIKKGKYGCQNPVAMVASMFEVHVTTTILNFT